MLLQQHSMEIPTTAQGSAAEGCELAFTDSPGTVESRNGVTIILGVLQKLA